jgi:D-alanyl-D-alanine carboxypeptidase/D-alanyl-D-alanine endopeptidase (penicillin-binding protein 7)
MPSFTRSSFACLVSLWFSALACAQETWLPDAVMPSASTEQTEQLASAPAESAPAAAAPLLATELPLWLSSRHALVVDEATGEVLLDKDADAAAPMASLSKLLTAMVVLDANQSPSEMLRITNADVDRVKRTHSVLPVGAQVERHALLELALLASDNRAAHALARNHPGGLAGFLAAVQAKADTLGLKATQMVEPTGLSPENRSSAADLVKVLAAAAQYPELSRITSQSSQQLKLAGAPRAVRNTNALVGRSGWEILLSKTGFTNEAGRCLAMRLRAAGRTVLVVLMDASASAERTLDALNEQRSLAGESPLAALPADLARSAAGQAQRKTNTLRTSL